MLRRFISTFVLVLLVVAAFAKPYKVTASKLNVRSTPSSSGTVLGSLTQGSKVEVNRISGGWAEITFQGKKAYISAQYIAPVAGAAAASSASSNKKTTAQNKSSQNNKGTSSNRPPQNPRKSGPPQNPRKNTAQNGKKGNKPVENSIEESRMSGFRATFDMRWAAFNGSFRQGTTGKFEAINIGADKKLINGLTSGFGFEYNVVVYKMSAANIMVGGRTGFSYDYRSSGSFKGTMNGQTTSGRCSYHTFTFPLQPQLSFEWMAGSMNMGFGFFTGPVFEAYFMRNLWKFSLGTSGGSTDIGLENYVTGHILGGGGNTIPESQRSGVFNCMWDTGIFLQLNSFRFFFSTAWGMHNFAWTKGTSSADRMNAHLNRPVAVGFQTLLGAKHKKKKDK